MWRELLRRLGLRRSRRSAWAIEADDNDVWATVGRVSPPGSLVLAEIEQAALAVYARHGLPTASGHYRRGPRARSWKFLGEHLTTEERWALLVDRPPEQGWRYAALADIGNMGHSEVKAASALLAQCARLRTWLKTSNAADRLDMMESAVRLGVDWRAFESGRSKRSNRLRLTAPDDAVQVPDRVNPPPQKRSRAKSSRPNAH